MLEKYPNDVKVVFKQFPLSMHKFAKNAALAALAAHEQGKFWEYHDELFKNQRQLGDKKFEEIAGNIGLDLEKFNADRKDRKLEMFIVRDMRDGQMAGVRGTPAIFVNGRRLKNRSMPGFQAAIDRELAKLKSVNK